MSISDIRSVRQLNRTKIIEAFKEYGQCTIDELLVITRLPLNIIETFINEMVFSGEVTLEEHEEGNTYSLNGDYKRVLAISIVKESNKRYIYYRIYNIDDLVIHEGQSLKKEISINDIYDIINICLARFENIRVIGLSIPGIINNGRISSTGIKEFDDIDLYSLLKNKYEQKIIIRNDVNSGAVGLYISEPKYDNVCLYFQPGNGLGGVGSVINGKLVVGKNNCAGEIQYLPLGVDTLKMLQTPHDTANLLAMVIASLTSVIDPELIAVSCLNLEKIEDVNAYLDEYLPNSYHPKLKKVDDISEYTLIGLNVLCKEALD